ncbi:MAG: haloacid dehalogenase [Acidobacteria bacterium]|nr:MAG: haloacid dehalogenase [Acidobacteriota bacterium]
MTFVLTPGQNGTPQTLLIDADDTLWENNVYFERAIADFISFLNHHEFTPLQVRERLNDVERESIKTHGYGVNSFANALCKTFECLSVEQLTGELREKIHAFAFRIAEHPVEIIAGVPETLRHLAARKHHLILMTKGAPAEQISKVERSGLKNYFAAVEVVGEKNARAYHAVAEKYALDTDVTWMIGNSPRSDVNPALEAGLHAVFVPHDMTWVLEHEELAAPIKAGQHLLKLDRFSDLTSHF